MDFIDFINIQIHTISIYKSGHMECIRTEALVIGD